MEKPPSFMGWRETSKRILLFVLIEQLDNENRLVSTAKAVRIFPAKIQDNVFNNITRWRNTKTNEKTEVALSDL